MAEATSGDMEAILLIILLFVVLFALKLAALGLVSYFGSAVAIPIVLGCLLLAYRWEAGTAGASKTGNRLD